MQDRPLQSKPTLFKKISARSSSVTNPLTLPCENEHEQSKESIVCSLDELTAFDSLTYHMLLGHFATKVSVTQSEYYKILAAIYCEDKNPLVQIDFEALIAMDDFFEQKYFILLKRILMPNSFFYANAQTTIRDPMLREEAALNKIKVTHELTHALLAVPSFCQHILNEFHLILEIIKEFTLVNQKHENENNKHLQIDIAKVKRNFKDIVKACRALEETKRDTLKIHP